MEPFNELPSDIQHNILDYYNLPSRRLISRSERDLSLVKFLSNSKSPSVDEIKSYLESIPSSILLISITETETLLYDFTSNIDSFWSSSEPVIIYEDAYDIELEEHRLDDIIQNDPYQHLDIKIYYHTIKSRALEMDVSNHLMKQIIHNIFDRTYNDLKGKSNLTLFLYYAYSFKILGLSFKSYYTILKMHPTNDDISGDLLDSMTNVFRLGIDRLIDTDF